MIEERTCGKGLAERAGLPEKLAALTQAMAEVLAFHQGSLDLTDETARKELQAYVRLGAEYRMITSLLNGAAGAMAGYRDLPMGRHDVRKLASFENAEIFGRFVRAERDLSDFLQGAIERDETMLEQMRDAARSSKV
jgi:hypothetical protein